MESHSSRHLRHYRSGHGFDRQPSDQLGQQRHRLSRGLGHRAHRRPHLAQQWGDYVVGQPVTMGATVGLGSSFITGVQFYVNNVSIGGGATPPNGQGSVPFWTASWTPAAPGSYTFTAIVTDSSGVQVTSAPSAITVSAVTTPTIIIASPSSATSLAPNIQQALTATVGVTNASVLNVQFFANNVSLGTVTAFPYTVNWTPATTGSYSVIAVLTTSAGTAVTSAPVVLQCSLGHTADRDPERAGRGQRRLRAKHHGDRRRHPIRCRYP